MLPDVAIDEYDGALNADVPTPVPSLVPLVGVPPLSGSVPANVSVIQPPVYALVQIG